nr:hypothetical protein [Tanacetum cinerariifolium]
MNAKQSIDGQNADQKTKERELDGLLDVVLEQFKPSFYGKPPAPKRLVVLGDDPKPRQTNYNRPFIRKEKPLPLYNHLGSNEVWEGVGSATMGGLDWH